MASLDPACPGGVGTISWSRTRATPALAHWLPAKVALPGSAPVASIGPESLSSMFGQLGVTTDDAAGPSESAPLNATLRGRTLAGYKYQLPSNYIGLMLVHHENQQPQQQKQRHGCAPPVPPTGLGEAPQDAPGVGEDQEGAASGRCWQAASTFSSITLWGHDTAPARGELSRKCLDWMELSQKIHAPVTKEQVLEQLSILKQKAPQNERQC